MLNDVEFIVNMFTEPFPNPYGKPMDFTRWSWNFKIYSDVLHHTVVNLVNENDQPHWDIYI